MQTAGPRKVGFIGLGLMGAPMAANLLARGTDLTVFDINPEAAEKLRAKGAKVAPSIADVARGSDVVFTSLPGPAQFEQVVTGNGGLVESLRRGQVIFDLSTNSREVVIKVGDAVSAAGGTLLDAPVSGGPEGAQSRNLVVWVGGNKSAFDAHRDLLEAISATPMHVGDIGAGSVTKLAHNMLGNTIMRALSESFSLAVKAGLDPVDYWNAIRHGAAAKQSPVFLLVNQFLPNSYDVAAFALELAYKDMNLALAMARQLDVPTSLANCVLEDMQACIAEGKGKKDAKIFLKKQLDRAGVTIQAPRDRIDAAVAAARAAQAKS